MPRTLLLTFCGIQSGLRSYAPQKGRISKEAERPCGRKLPLFLYFPRSLQLQIVIIARRLEAQRHKPAGLRRVHPCRSMVKLLLAASIPGKGPERSSGPTLQ